MALEIQTQRVMERKLVDKMSRERGLLQRFTIAAVALMAAASAFGLDEVLYWMVDDTSVVHYGDGTTISLPLLVPEAIDTTLAARVRVVGEELSEDVFLNVYSDGEVWSTDLGIDFGDPGSGYWGVGNPTGMQSPLTGGMAPDHPYISVREGQPEYSFIIEIGNYDWNEDSWTTVAHSQAYTHSELLTSSYIYESFDINPPTTKIWNPHDYYASVPEPNGSLLVLVGAAMLLLKRKKT